MLVQLAVSMRAHKRGGLLLVVPAGTERWRESIVAPIAYALDPPFSRARRADAASGLTTANRLWEDALGRAIDAVAGLTAVDGATIITDRYELLAFGAKITRRRGSPPVETADGHRADRRRHRATSCIPRRSAARGTCRPRSSSHDQRMRSRSSRRRTAASPCSPGPPCENMVHAHRVEALLL